jgi:NADH-quinone oxidoreductase subunit J
MTTILGSLGSLGVLTDLAEAGGTSTGEEVLFWCLAPVMVLAALGLVFARRAVYAALSVVVVMVGLAVLYVAQEAPFLGAVQVIVYTGAVMMLFLFVLMLVGVDTSESFADNLRGQRWVAALLGAGLAAVLIGVVLRAREITPVGLAEQNEPGNPVGIARIIFGDYVFTLQVVGILLVTAAVGAIVLTHRRGTRRCASRRGWHADAAPGAGRVRAQQRDGRRGAGPGRAAAGAVRVAGAAGARAGAVAGRGASPDRARRRCDAR